LDIDNSNNSDTLFDRRDEASPSPTTDRREIRWRRITEPKAEQKSLQHQLQLSLPDRLRSLFKM
jgi:hypothetical protein